MRRLQLAALACDACSGRSLRRDAACGPKAGAKLRPADLCKVETLRQRIAACDERSREAALRQGAAAGCRWLCHRGQTARRSRAGSFADGGRTASSGLSRGLPSAAWGGGERHALKRGLIRGTACGARDRQMRASAAGGFGPPMATPSSRSVCDDARQPTDPSRNFPPPNVSFLILNFSSSTPRAPRRPGGSSRPPRATAAPPRRCPSP